MHHHLTVLFFLIPSTKLLIALKKNGRDWTMKYNIYLYIWFNDIHIYMIIWIYSSYIMNMYILGRLNGFGNGFPRFFFLNMWVSPDFGYVFCCRRSCWWLAPFHTKSWGNLKRPVKVVDVPRGWPHPNPGPHILAHFDGTPGTPEIEGGKLGKDRSVQLTFCQREIFASRNSEGCYLFFW